MIQQKNLILLTLAGLFLVSCGPQKKEETQPEAPQDVSPQPPQPKGGTLTPRQEEELKIEEENVMEPFPG